MLSAFLPAQSLKGAARTPGGGQNWLAKGLVVFQFTISAIFVISAIVVGNQMRYMLHKDLGYSQNASIHFEGDFSDPGERKDHFAQRFRNLPGVLAVSSDMLPPSISGSSRTTMEYRPGAKIDIESSVGGYQLPFGIWDEAAGRTQSCLSGFRYGTGDCDQ